MGAVHPSLCYKDFNVMKICTIILISMMTLALKVLDMFTLSMGTLIFESVSQVALCTAHPASPKKHLQQSRTTNAALCLWGSTDKIFNTQPKWLAEQLETERKQIWVVGVFVDKICCLLTHFTCICRRITNIIKKTLTCCLGHSWP